MEDGRKPFVFGVVNILGEPKLGSLLHKQFTSDEDLAAEVRRMGFKVNFDVSQTVVDDQSGAVVETVGVDKNGGVGSLDLIDQKEIPKVQTYIDEANRRKRLINKNRFDLLT